MSTAYAVRPARRSPGTWGQGRCQGVVLVIALVLLMAISLLAASTLRNAISTESVSGAVRTSETALQAAEMALRYCERSALASIASASTPVNGAGGAAPITAVVPPLWQDLANWDGASPKRIALPLDAINAAGAHGLYRRPPECLAEPLVVAADPGDADESATVYVITARGFGSDVSAQPAQGRPAGTEVWLQSQIEQIHTAGAARAPTRAWRQLFVR
jgi:type IV pilus assembly protein PilX